MRKTVLVFDNGLFPAFATRLAAGGDHVLYYSPWRDAFPLSRRVLPGEGLPGVERVNHFYEHIDDADLICFPDVGRGDMQSWLREQGKLVWGSANAEILELDRVGLRRLLSAKRLPVAPAEILDGIDALREHLEDAAHDDEYVKIGEYRGDFETFHHVNWFVTEPWYDRLRHQLGPMGKRIPFVVEESIAPAIEVGYDGWCIDGEYPPIAMYGYEAKDMAYVGRIVPHAELPRCLTKTMDRLSPVLKELGCRSMFSTEVRVTPDGTAYLIDPTMRCPSPPGESLMGAFSNWPDIVHEGADGNVVLPEPLYTHTAQLMLSSDWSDDEFLALRFPEEHRDHIKLHGHAIIDDVDYVVVTGMEIGVIGAACGYGNSMQEAVDMAKEVAKSVEGMRVVYDDSAFDNLEDKINEGIRYGVPWD